MNQRGVIHLLPLLLILAAVAVAVYFVVKGNINIPFLQKKASVEIKTTYKNPFDKNTQYVNPFEKYKNPFVTGR